MHLVLSAIFDAGQGGEVLVVAHLQLHHVAGFVHKHRRRRTGAHWCNSPG